MLRDHYRSRRRDAECIDFGVTSIHDLAPRPSEVLGERRDERLLLEALRRIPLEHQVLLEGPPSVASLERSARSGAGPLFASVPRCHQGRRTR